MTSLAAPAYDPQLRSDQVRLGLWMFLGTVTMLFAAFASAYIVRRSGTDWRPIELPRILWANTLILATSSGALEFARRYANRGCWVSARAALWVTVALGISFIAGQLAAWRALVAAGVFLPTSPHSSFFYMLTGAHGVHVLAALVVLLWGVARTRAARAGRPSDWATTMSVCRTFWHFLGGVWLFLLVLMVAF